MKAFRTPLHELGDVEEILGCLKKNRGVLQVTGCIDSQKSHFIDCLSEGYAHKVIVAANDLKAKEIYENYKFFDRDVMFYPAKDFIFFQADIHSNLLEQQRIGVWKALAENKPVTVILTMAAFMNHLMPFGQWKQGIRTLNIGDVMNLEEWKSRLVELGYERTAQAEGPGQFSVRGGILDIFPLTEENPVRIELWGDEVDSIRSFDAQSQRSIENLESVTIYPASELILEKNVRKIGLKKLEQEGKKAETVLRGEMKTEEAHRVKQLVQECKDKLEEFEDPSGLDGFLDYFYPDAESILECFPEDTVFFLDEPNRLAESAEAAEREFRESMQHRMEKGYALAGQSSLLFSCQQMIGALSGRNCVGLCTLENIRGSWDVTGKYGISVRGVNPYNNSFELLVKDLQKWKKEGYRVILLAASRIRGGRLAEDLRDQELNAFYSEDGERTVQSGEILVTYGNAHRGYEYPMIRFVVISESDIFGREKKKKKKRTSYEGSRISSFSELSVGDYVVHENHGLGVYRGIEKIESDHVMKDYMKIEYADGSNLYVLATQLDMIQKYADADAKKPKLNKLGTQEWSRTKSRVRGAVRVIAQELVDLYAVRQKKEGFVYGPDTVWQKEFEEMFPFEETEDQLQTIDAVKADMESTKIMDRLVCGDVGYGKTEIAIRAAFKAVQEGKQVAYLVPTTILAQQHYNTFTQRMKDFPVRVDLMCRFSTPAEQKKTIADLKKGMVDIVIGTHRILSKDVEFKDLGLLIIDEEQRFGVTHKEKIKQMKKDVDVLTLTATPIPRTLHMSLIGIRDMSVLEEAPQDRLPVQTFVMEYNEEMVREAISRELARGGQVYYVYNRVNTIVEMTNTIAKLAPEARVAFAHGQMKERELESIMYDFINGDIDVLVTTTIIETGLDISNANTMIIHDADNMGLSQLYQLRGRVGRSNRTSYAFLMYRRNKMLKEIAEKRLSAIREFTELGSGFKIAMRDLEIRGAGNLLGSEQHGHMEAVGYDLYCKLLNESVKEIRGESTLKEGYETAIDLDVDAFIPDRYIRNEGQKMDIYKRIAAISGEEEYDDMMEELMDRFGEPPRSVQNLLAIARLKAQAHQIYVTELTQKGDEIRIVLYERAMIDAAKIDTFLKEYGGRMKFTVDTNPYFIYSRPKKGGRENDDVLLLVGDILDHMKILEQNM